MPKQKNEYFCETIFCSPNDFQKKKNSTEANFFEICCYFLYV